MPEIKIKSLREPAMDSVDLFLHQEGFGKKIGVKEGVIHILDRVAGYREEGVRLFPEILITADLPSIAKTLPSPLVTFVGSGEPSSRLFKLALKQCAPLARDGWCVFVEVKAGEYSFGVIANVSSSASKSSANQLLESFDKLPTESFFLRSVSGSRVRLIGRSETIELRFALEEDETDDKIAIDALAGSAAEAVDERLRPFVHRHLSSMIQQACEESHGALIAVIDSERNCAELAANASRFAFLRPAITFVNSWLERSKKIPGYRIRR